MPGVTSLEKQEYYGFPQNAFWKILFTHFVGTPAPKQYDERIALLAKHQIAVWDVLAHCERKGSLDIHIKNQVENDLPSLLKQHPKIRKILFNGKEAHRYFTRKFSEMPDYETAVMPSTSPANTMPFAEKLKIWSAALSS